MRQAGTQRDAGLGEGGGLCVHPRHLPARRVDIAAPQQRLQPGLVRVRRQIGGIFGQDGAFGGLVKTAVAPALADQGGAPSGIAARHQGFAQPHPSDAGSGRTRAEPGDYLGGIHVWSDRLFGARIKRVPQRPVRRHFHNRVYVGEFGAAVPVQRIAPLQQLAGHAVLPLIAQRQGIGPVAFAGGSEGTNKKLVIGGGQDSQAGGMDAGGNGGGVRHRRGRNGCHIGDLPKRHHRDGGGGENPDKPAYACRPWSA